MAADSRDVPVMKIPHAEPRTETPIERTTPMQLHMYGEMDSKRAK